MITRKGYEIRKMIRHQKSTELMDNTPYKYHCQCEEISIENSR